jgi:hypothetical protein
MTRIRRGGYIFLTRESDHPPRHAHVYKEGRLVLRWDLEGQKPLTGQASRRVIELIRELCSEGRL